MLHNSVQQADGIVGVAPPACRPPAAVDGERTDVETGPGMDFASMWDDLGTITVPVQLLVGDRSPVVDDADKAAFAERHPDADIITVADAGHSIQGDQPLELARLVEAFLTR